MGTLLAARPVETEVAPAIGVQVAGRARSHNSDMPAAVGAAFAALGEYMREYGIEPTGPPRVVYLQHDAGGTRFTAAFPVPEWVRALPREGAVSIDALPAGPVYRFEHRGPYDGLGATYAAITEWLREEGLLRTDADWTRFMPLWEEYPNAPGETAPEDLLTRVFLPRRG